MGKVFCNLLYCVEKDAPELGDTTRRVFPVLFWECAISTANDMYHCMYLYFLIDLNHVANQFLIYRNEN